MLPLGSSSRRLSIHSTHCRVANLTASSERQGPRPRITSVMQRPLLLWAKALSIAVADAADQGLDACLGAALGMANTGLLLGFNWSSQHLSALIAAPHQEFRLAFSSRASCVALR